MTLKNRWPLLDHAGIRMSWGDSPSSKRDILQLRDEIYVQEQRRLGAVEDTLTTFDRWDGFATYFVASDSDGPIGAVKIIEDSEMGLPCESIARLKPVEVPGKRIEVGHLLSAPRARSARLGMLLMKQALVFGVGLRGARLVYGDFFADKSAIDGLQPFYQSMGFHPASDVYRDPRFVDAPPSVVGVMDVTVSAARRPHAQYGARRILDFFFSDYPWVKSDEISKGART